MIQYDVLDSRVDGAEHSIYLRDAHGACHWARVTAEVPDTGTALHGGYPRLGFATLASRTGQVYRVIFEAIDAAKSVDWLKGPTGR